MRLPSVSDISVVQESIDVVKECRQQKESEENSLTCIYKAQDCLFELFGSFCHLLTLVFLVCHLYIGPKLVQIP
jgi:hypothetical protein